MPDTIPVRLVRLDRQGCKTDVHFENPTTTGLSDSFLTLALLSISNIPKVLSSLFPTELKS